MRVCFPGGKTVAAEFRGFTVLTDQPDATGGSGSAPSPFDLFLASLATCTGYYVLAFCQKRGIPTEEIELSLTTVRNEETRMIERIEIKVHLPAGFPEKYVGACLKAASQCAVKKHLQNPPHVELTAERE